MSAVSLSRLAPVSRLLAAIKPSRLFAPGEITIARAPGRLDVMGGIADYTGSLVCEMPLGVAAVAAVQSRADGRVVCRSEQSARRAECSVNDLRTTDAHKVRALFDGDDKWARYAVGCLWWLLRHDNAAAEKCKGISILIDSDVPLGGGVSSSAAIEVATMSAIVAMLGIKLAPLRLAVACQEVENHVVGAPCGVMDQVTSAMGRDGAMVEILCQAGADKLPAQVLGEVRVPAGYAFIGIHSGVRHEVSGDPYTDTRVAAFMGLRILNAGASGAPPINHLANLDATRYLDSLRSRLPERLRGDQFLETYEKTDDTVTRVRPDTVYHVRSATDHHVLEASRVPRFVALLRNPGADNAMELAGSLMYESHGSYGHNARLGHDLTNHLVGMIQALGTRAGFYGAKITGGGCGGTVAILIRDEDAVRERVESLRSRYSTETGRQTMLFTGTSPGADQAGTLTKRYEELP